MRETPDIKEIIWDGDNTIWTWISYAAKAYPAMARIIAEETGLPYERIVAGMREYYSMIGTMESAMLIQGMKYLGIFKRAPKAIDERALIRSAQRTFSQVRRSHFKPFNGAVEAIKTANREGIINRILTDAPLIQAIQRAKKAGIDKHIDSLHAVQIKPIEGFNPQLPDYVQQKQDAGEYDIDCFTEELPVEKPDNRLETIITASPRSIRGNIRTYIQNHVIVIGDSARKDMGTVTNEDCYGIHATWAKIKQKDLDIILQFAPESIAQKHMSNGRKKLNWSKITTIDNHQELLGPNSPLHALAA